MLAPRVEMRCKPVYPYWFLSKYWSCVSQGTKQISVIFVDSSILHRLCVSGENWLFLLRNTSVLVKWSSSCDLLWSCKFNCYHQGVLCCGFPVVSIVMSCVSQKQTYYLFGIWGHSSVCHFVILISINGVGQGGVFDSFLKITAWKLFK